MIQSNISDMPAISEAHLRLLLQNLGEAIFMLDPLGKVEGWTPAAQRVFGYQRKEIAGLTAAVLYAGNGPDELAAFMASALKSGRAEADAWHLRHDGTRFWAHEVMCPISEGGHNAGFAVIVRDLSELKEKELILQERSRALEQSNRELEQFASIASHDLQEPLRKILAFGDRLQTLCAGSLDPKASDYLQRILSASQRMRQLIDDLLTYSRFASGSVTASRVDLGRLCSQVLVDLEEQIAQSGASIELGEMPSLMAERSNMRQLLQNLISNALKFVKPGVPPKIRVGCRDMGKDAEGDEVWELFVEDEGIGFDEKYHERIFTMLERLHSREEYEGTGMGLAICRRIAERHGGSISAKSRPGYGSRFTVTMKTGALKEGAANDEK